MKRGHAAVDFEVVSRCLLRLSFGLGSAASGLHGPSVPDGPWRCQRQYLSPAAVSFAGRTYAC